MGKVHVVNHTHWDCEWYFTSSDALVLSDQSFTLILDELENNPRSKFCLDGQVSVLDEYAALRPERIEQIRKLVKQGRLSVGPWFTQTDSFFVHAESIIRNLVIGIKETKKYGDYMRIGYLPDTFGFNAQMPTILANAGINSIIFWRGLNFDKHVDEPYFCWKGLADKEILAINLPHGYGIAAHLNTSRSFLEKRLFPAVKMIQEKTSLDEIIIPSGGDQLDIIKDLPEKIDDINEKSADQYVVSRFEDFIDVVEKSKEKLKEIRGEFREPCTARVHKTIGSVRYDIKRMNYLIEQKLLNRVEALVAIGRKQGIRIGTGIINKAWKKILKGHAHDSMGGCVSDSVAVDILHRMKEADEICDAIENMVAKKLAEQIGVTDQQIIIFNTLPYDFSGYKVVEFISHSKEAIIDTDSFTLIDSVFYEGKENLLLETPEGKTYLNESPYYKIKALVKVNLPAMGYKVFNIRKKIQPATLVGNSTSVIENEFYKVEFGDGKLVLKTNFGKTITDFISFEDCGNDGDTYDFSPLRNDKPVVLHLQKAKAYQSQDIQIMELTGTFTLPLKLEDRLERKKSGEVGIKLRIELIKGIPYLKCRCLVNNGIYSHRLRVKIHTDLSANESIASVPFGYIRREIQHGQEVDWEGKYVEWPIDIEPFDESVSVSNEEYHITVFGKGVKEYQICDESLYITLFATTSQLGKPNLLYRPGRASGDTTKKGHVMIPTPMAEQLGIREFEFAISAAKGEFDEYQTAKIGEQYQTQDISYQLQTVNKFINRLDNKIQESEEVLSKSPEKFSLLTVDSELIYSSISPSLYDDAVLLRLKNPGNRTIALDSIEWSNFRKFAVVNYIEDLSEDQELQMNPYDTLTIKLWY